jgi:hypothetical protein
MRCEMTSLPAPARPSTLSGAACDYLAVYTCMRLAPAALPAHTAWRVAEAGAE